MVCDCLVHIQGGFSRPCRNDEQRRNLSIALDGMASVCWHVFHRMWACHGPEVEKGCWKTYQQTSEIASAIVLLARQRLIEATTSWTQKQPASTAFVLEHQPDLKHTITDSDDAHKRKIEHGRPYRVFCSMWMKERHLSNEDMVLKSCAAAYKIMRE